MLQALLAEGRPLLADGATGTNLFAMGLASGETPELWNAVHPDRIQALHRAFVDAGSDIILTNSFGGNRRRLMLHGLEPRARELNRLAAQNARAVADRAGRPVVVAGSVGPTGDIFKPLGPISEDEAVDVFVEQIEGLSDGGADVVWIETMSAADEIRAAARAAARVGMPYTVTASFDTAGRTMMGVAPAALGALVADFDPKPLAYGANCGVGASESAGRGPRHERRRSGSPVDRQGECRRAALAWRRNPLFRHARADGGLRGARRRLRHAHHRRLLRQHAGACGGDAARPRRPQARRAPDPRVDRRRARPPRRAARRRAGRAEPPPRARMNAKAKRRAWGRSDAPEAVRPPDAAPRAPLMMPSGPQVFDVGASGAGERLDRFLGQAAMERRVALSRTRLKALIEAGEVTVDGTIARDPAIRLIEGARIAFEAPPPEASPLLGEDLPLDVVYEDEHLIVIDKPAGLVVHPAPGHAGGTLVNALIRHCGASLSGVGGVRRPGIVHRLDKDTSGLLVVAKTDAAHRGLAELFADHGRTGSLEREYLALVWGGLEATAGKVDAAIARHPRHREKMALAPPERGRHAVTHWRLEETLGPASLVSCRLETGRTHQIRVHMASIGHPLMGDSVYGAGFKTKAAQLSEGAKQALAALGRQALHAAALGFEHPITGEQLRFEGPPPEDFNCLVKALRVQCGDGSSSKTAPK